MITIKYIRDYILDNNITEHDTLIMHPADFDTLVLEYRNTYGSSIELPYYLLGVLVKPDNTTAPEQLKVVKNDPRSITYELESSTVYRCGWCGNVVDADGSELPEERNTGILIVMKYGEGVCEKVKGECCKGSRV
jgi:hypothetical protein